VAHLPTDFMKAAAQRAATVVITTVVDPGAAAHHAAAQVRELPRTAARLPLRIALGGLTAVERVRTRKHRSPQVLPPAPRSVAPTQVPKPASPAPAPAADAFVAADVETAALSRGSEELPLEEQVDAVLDAAGETATPTPMTTPPSKAASKAPSKSPARAKAPAKAPVKAAAPVQAPAEAPVKAAAPVKAPAPVTALAPAPAPHDEPVATVTPIHAGRDGHREVELSPPVAAAVESAPEGATLSSAELPLAGYDGLSLAQVRSRLSKLDVVEVAQLRDYERAHADRAPIVTMLENRLAKVAAQPAPSPTPAAQTPAPPAPPAPPAGGGPAS